MGPEPHHAPTGKEMGGESADQYHDERQVKQHHGNTPIQLLPDEVGACRYGEHGP